MARRNASPPPPPPYDQPCPHCGAPAGYGCVRSNGSPSAQPHTARANGGTEAEQVKVRRQLVAMGSKLDGVLDQLDTLVAQLNATAPALQGTPLGEAALRVGYNGVTRALSGVEDAKFGLANFNFDRSPAGFSTQLAGILAARGARPNGRDDELVDALASLPQDPVEDDVAALPEHLRVLLAESFAALREQLAAEARAGGQRLTAAQRQAVQAQLTKLKQLADRQRAFSVGAQRNLTAAQRDALRALTQAQAVRAEKNRLRLRKRQ